VHTGETTPEKSRVSQGEQARLPTPLSACNSPKVTPHWTRGRLGVAWAEAHLLIDLKNNAVMKSTWAWAPHTGQGFTLLTSVEEVQ